MPHASTATFAERPSPRASGGTTPADTATCIISRRTPPRRPPAWPRSRNAPLRPSATTGKDEDPARAAILAGLTPSVCRRTALRVDHFALLLSCDPCPAPL